MKLNSIYLSLAGSAGGLQGWLAREIYAAICLSIGQDVTTDFFNSRAAQ